jgi:hypothetical protein
MEDSGWFLPFENFFLIFCYIGSISNRGTTTAVYFLEDRLSDSDIRNPYATFDID